MQLISDIKGGEDGNFCVINNVCLRRNLLHTLINVGRYALEIVAVALSTEVIRLVVNIDSDRRGRLCISFSVIHTHLAIFPQRKRSKGLNLAISVLPAGPTCKG